MSSTMSERTPPIEIDADTNIRTAIYATSGEYLLSGGTDSIRVLRVEDGKQTATMEASYALCLAVSKNGMWLAAGTWHGGVFIWEAETYKQVFEYKDGLGYAVNGVDFSPNSTQLLVASDCCTATIWDLSTQKQKQIFRHDYAVVAAKFSPEGDRIATATPDHARIWDSNDGRLLMHIPVKVTPYYNTGLCWLNSHLFVVSDGTIKQFETSTDAGSPVSEWPVPSTGSHSCIVLPQHGNFIAYSTNHTVLFWDTSARTQFGLIHHPQDIRSIALSPDDRFLIIAGKTRKITVHILNDILPASYSTQPLIDISDTALDSWKHGRLAETEATLAGTIVTSLNQNHRALANRALVRARLRRWDLAIEDAEHSIHIRPSAIGYIAKSVALIGGGRKAAGLRVYDLVFRHCDPNDADFLLLVKAVVLFMAGEHNDAVSRVGDLIVTARLNSIYCVVQAYMYLLLGDSNIEGRNYEGAIRSFERARTQMRDYTGPCLSTISLISGWTFDDLGFTIRQRLCESLYTAGRSKDAGEALLEMVNAFDDEAYMSGAIGAYVSDFMQRYLSVRETDDDAASSGNSNPTTPQTTLDPPISTAVLRVWAKVTLASRSWKDALVAAVGFTFPRFTIYRVVCERLETIDCTMDVVECLRQMESELAGERGTQVERAKWAFVLKQRCAEKLTRLGDVAVDTQQYDEAITQYAAALSLNPAVPQDILIKRIKVRMAIGLWEDALDDANQVIMHDPSSQWGFQRVLTEWAKVRLTADETWRNALQTAHCFNAPKFAIYRSICERLETLDRIMDATECFHHIAGNLARETDIDQTRWIIDFKYRCGRNLETLGDLAMSARQYERAISQYSAALSLSPPNPQLLFVKRSKARANMGLWKDALDDANEVIALDPSSPFGYERKHIALRGAGFYGDARHAFETMLSKMSESSDVEIRERSHRYINPTQTEATVRVAIQNAIRDSPLVLINTDSGRLLDKPGQASSFESQPIFHELVASMTTDIDHVRIEDEVAQYYRYATFSHKWGDNEPLYEKVIHIVVYDLEESPSHEKLQMFCKIVRDAGLHWAWSDTCCINKADHVVLQEALVSMFQWYQSSTVTIVLLCDVCSPSRRGDLVRSIWNSRAWTFQEYHASKVVRFYNKDWTLYRNLDVPNHKESPEIISEMEEATGVSARTLMALQPGSDDIREKLSLASIRQTTRVEDAAYSLFGIFSLSLPVVYGEGDKALGRLLAQLLISSGDTRILAWTGKSGSFNSCLPAKIAVFKQLPTSHLPPAVTAAEMAIIRYRALSVNLALITKLYDLLDELPVPSFAGKRMNLPCIAFKLGPLSGSRSGSEQIFRAQTIALGIVKITTEEDLSRLESSYLVHPWIDFLLDRQPVGNVTEIIPKEDADDESRSIRRLPPFSESFNSPSEVSLASTAGRSSRFGLPFGGRGATRSGDTTSLRPPSTLAEMDKQMRALQVLARLRQPFGALLLTLDPSNVSAYRRVAAESLITVQVEETTPTILKKLVESIRVLDVL